MSAAATSSASPASVAPGRDRLLRGVVDRRARGEERARAGAAEAGAAVGIAVDEADLLDRDAEHVDDELRVGGRDPLSHRHRRGVDLDLAGSRHGHRDALLEDVAAGPFEERGKAAPAQPAARARLRLARGEALPLGEIERLLDDAAELAAVIDLPHRVGIGHLLRRDEIAAADLGGIEAELARCGVEQPLDEIDRLGPPGAAIGRGRRGMRQHRVQVEIDRLDVVDAGRDPGPDHELDDDPDRARIGAHVAERVDAIGQHLAVGIERELGMALDIAPVRRCQKLLDPLRRPFHRTLQQPRGIADDEILGIEAGLHAEAAADIADDDAHLLGRQAEQIAQRVARAGGHLAREAQRQPVARGIVIAERAARLHRRRRQALVDEVERDDMRRLGEGGIRRRLVAVLHLRRDVAGGVGPDERGARGGRRRQLGHRGQLLVRYLDRLERILRLGARLGDERGDAFADEAHDALRQRRPQRRRAGRAVGAREDRRDGQGLHA